MTPETERAIRELLDRHLRAEAGEQDGDAPPKLIKVPPAVRLDRPREDDRP